MTALLVLCGAVALSLPGLRPGLAPRAEPRWSVRFDALALALGLLSIFAGLVLSLAVGLIHLAAGSSPWYVGGHLAPGGVAASVVSAALLFVLVTRMVRAGQRARHAARLARPEEWLGQHERRHDHDLVVLPTTRPVAYSVGGSPPQVVISEGLRAQLDDDIMTFVVDHERSHLRHRHRHYLLLAVLLAAAFRESNMVGRSAIALQLALERTADEEAAGPDQRRRRRFGAAVDEMSVHAPVGCAADALFYRARHLASPPPSRPAAFELLAAGGLLVLATVAAAAAGHATGDVPGLLALFQR